MHIATNHVLCKKWLYVLILHSLFIKKIQNTALSLASNGTAEKAVHTCKTLLHKTLATFPDYEWYSFYPLL